MSNLNFRIPAAVGYQSALMLALLFLIPACGANGFTAPTRPASSGEPAMAGQWSGTVQLSSVTPDGSCEARYLADHSGLLTQPATAELELNGESATMSLRTAGNQQCVFSGTATNGSLRLSTRHEECDGYPLAAALIIGIGQFCHTIDLAGDGPYWGSGTFTGRVADSEIDAQWSFQVYDPGGGSYGATRFMPNLDVHLSRQLKQ